MVFFCDMLSAIGHILFSPAISHQPLFPVISYKPYATSSFLLLYAYTPFSESGGNLRAVLSFGARLPWDLVSRAHVGRIAHTLRGGLQ
jgi:hypothetical protein